MRILTPRTFRKTQRVWVDKRLSYRGSRYWNQCESKLNLVGSTEWDVRVWGIWQVCLTLRKGHSEARNCWKGLWSLSSNQELYSVLEHRNLNLSTELIGKLATVKRLKADVLVTLWRKANARKSQLWMFLRWPIYLINSVDESKFSCFTSQPTQHHSFLRNWPLYSF